MNKVISWFNAQIEVQRGPICPPTWWKQPFN